MNSKADNLTEEQYNDIYNAWDNIEEVLTDFRELSDREIIEVKAAIINRLTVALEYLDEFLIEDK